MPNNASPTRSWLISAVLAAAVVAGACGGKQPPPEPVAPPTPEQVVTAANRVLEQWEQGYEVVSATALLELYMPGVDTRLVVQGKHYRGSSGIEAYLTELLTRIEEFRIDFGTVSVSALGDDAAEITAEIKREYKEGSTTVVESGVLSLTLSRVDDKWLIRTEHYSYGR